MSDRLIRHSSRYKGPAGDSRPPKEIEDGIIARMKQQEEYEPKLIAAMDDVLENATLMSFPGRVEFIKQIAFAWILDHDIELRERVERAGEGAE